MKIFITDILKYNADTTEIYYIGPAKAIREYKDSCEYALHFPIPFKCAIVDHETGQKHCGDSAKSPRTRYKMAN